MPEIAVLQTGQRAPWRAVALGSPFIFAIHFCLRTVSDSSLLFCYVYLWL